MSPHATILAVDDTSESLALLADTLVREGYQVRAADSGELALAAAAAQPPDLILLDIRMQGLDGLEVCRQLKAQEATRHIPIILLSAFAEVAEWTRGLQLGAVDYITKPFQVEELLARVNTHLTLHRAHAALAQQAKELLESNAIKDSLLRTIPFPMVIRDGDGQVMFLSELTRGTFGLASEELPGRLPFLAPHPPGDEGGEPRSEQPSPNLQELGGRTYHIHRSDMVFQGQPACLELYLDITERQRAEAALQELNHHLDQKVAERTLALQQTNAELEAFAHSVSHDLRSPLRAISGFAQALAEDCKPHLPPEGQDYLQRIRDGALRMGDLLDDLLRLSRVGRHDLVPTTIDLVPLVKDITFQLAEGEPARSLNLVLPPRLETRADPGLLRILLENLLGNAWKFSAGQSEVVIEVGSSMDPQHGRVFYVRDRGIGFAMAQAKRLFTAFERLPSAKGLPGTGIGLAIVRRIAARHGGRTWAQSEPGAGTTIFFTLPAPEVHP